MTYPIMPSYDCPVCQYHMDAVTATVAVPRAPGPDDITICAKCGEFLIFDQDMKVRSMDLHDMLKVSPEGQAQMSMMQALIREQRPLG
jgi:C4-type Zn-finger protein